MTKVENLADAKKRRADQKYKDLVMQKFMEVEHRDKRDYLDKRAAVEAAARERL